MRAYTEAFEYAFAETLEKEGGWSDHEHDSGGKTKFGITEANWARYAAQLHINCELRNITVADAKAFYFREFWEEYRCELLPHKAIAAEYFDTAVNAGPSVAGKCLQRALNFVAFPGWPRLAVDGVVGPITRARARLTLDKGLVLPLLISMNGAQWSFYESLSEQNTWKFNHFTRGWTRRLQLAMTA